MPEKTHKVAQEKKEIVKRIVELVKEHPIMGIVNMENLPAAQLQKMKKHLRGKVELFMTKISLISLALGEAKNARTGIEQLHPYVKGMPALLFTKENPFALYKILKKSKSPAAAKPGQTAPRDIVVPAGPTPFTPGPVISEFSALGIKAGVEGGKVAVKQDTVVCQEGKQISGPLASMLARLGIEPMEVGLDLVVVLEKGVIYGKKVLDIDETAFLAQITQAASEAFNLAVEIVLPITDTVDLLLQKAFRESKAVAKEGNILTSEVAEELVSKAEREMTALKSSANIASTEHHKEEIKKEEPPTQEAKKPAAPKDAVEASVNKMVEDLKKHETPKPSAEKMVNEVKKEQDTAQSQKTKKEIEDVEALTKKLVKKGTLR